jgi:hypothetical protein
MNYKWRPDAQETEQEGKKQSLAEPCPERATTTQFYRTQPTTCYSRKAGDLDSYV